MVSGVGADAEDHRAACVAAGARCARLGGLKPRRDGSASERAAVRRPGCRNVSGIRGDRSGRLAPGRGLKPRQRVAEFLLLLRTRPVFPAARRIAQ
jgi:hypothetical protein